MRILQAIIFAFLLMLTFTYCDRQASLRDAIARAITQTAQVQSYRIMSNSTAHIDGTTKVSSYELEYAAPDRYHLFTTANVEGGNVSTTTTINDASVTVTTHGGWLEIIVAGDKGYYRSSNEPQWRICEFITSRLTQPTPGASPCTFFLLTLEHIMESKLEPFNYLVGLEVLPDEEINGVKSSHYRYEIDQDSYVDILMERNDEENGQIPPDILELMLQSEIVVDLWIDGDDYIRQQRTDYCYPSPIIKEKWVSVFSITRYFDFNESICIEPPEIESE